jgi:hypothetical protein
MRFIAEQKLVLGSETAAGWAMDNLAYTHGSFSVHNKIHYAWMKNKDYGKWWPQERPQIFFAFKIDSPEYLKGRYDPFYRIPLYQAAFHEAIISTDRWEIPHAKLTNAVNVREILELLYGVPSIWAFDKKELKKQQTALKNLYEFFSPLHKGIATLPLSDFQILSKDRLVQATIWGEEIKLIANFSNNFYEDLPPSSIKMLDLKTKKARIYQP